MPMANSETLFWSHSSYLCFTLGVLCCLVNSRMDAWFQANLQTAEAQLFARHFGLSMLLIAFFCHATAAAGNATPDLTLVLVAYHGAVFSAFIYEVCTTPTATPSSPCPSHD